MGTEQNNAAKGNALLRFCWASGSALVGYVLVVALGLSNGRDTVEVTLWVAIAAGVACLIRSLIHIVWGEYLTRHPSHYPQQHRERVELNVLVPLNILLSGAWIWLGFSTLGQDKLDPPFLPALAISVLVTLVGMETVRCVRWTDKRRGTEIVCEGPVGAWFRDFFTTSNEGTGPVHKIMVFLRNPNRPRTISRFLMVLAALLLAPSSVDASTSVGLRINRLIFGTPAPAVAGSDRYVRQGQEGADLFDGEQAGSGEEDSWEDQCAAVYDGSPAPSPNREELAYLFEAAGSEAAGCPGPAKKVAAQERVWYANSYCGSELRATGVTAPGYLPAILYQQAARFADARAREGVLLGASSRWRYQGGDLYVVNTTNGSFVLARRLASAGGTEAESGNLPCQSYVGGNVPYAVVPPGLLVLWLELAETEWVWPQSTGLVAGNRSFEFVLAYPAEDIVATARCASDQQCVLSVDGEERVTPPGLPYTSVPEIARLAH